MARSDSGEENERNYSECYNSELAMLTPAKLYEDSPWTGTSTSELQYAFGSDLDPEGKKNKLKEKG